MNKELPADSILAHYRLVSKIGAGGMGEVYLAQDTKLNRKVALKILPADHAVSQDRMRRFVQEAQSAAALNHPNIAHIYEIGEYEGTSRTSLTLMRWQLRTLNLAKRTRPLPRWSKYSMLVATLPATSKSIRN